MLLLCRTLYLVVLYVMTLYHGAIVVQMHLMTLYYTLSLCPYFSGMMHD